jgi:hypothetical protein
MKCSLQLKHAFECTVCLQDMFSEEAKTTQAVGRMIGAVDFGLCPGCGQEVHDFKNSAYRARARKYIASLERGQ